LLCSGQILDFVATDAIGTAVVTYRIPIRADLLGARFFNQFLIQDPTPNALGFAASHGGRGTMGN
jgi:hypothetical protein